MNFNTTSHDKDNRIATDIVECPKCDSENVLFKDQKYNSYTDAFTFFFVCQECNNNFKEAQ
mgnify:CR=1 FL=1|tara:strand:- start:369 stop:551 length:183 start_codon:yes stop_codon:yes gene_type:complete